MNKIEKLIMKNVDGLKFATQIIAILLCCILIAASALITFDSVFHLLNNDPKAAILDALFVAILLELFYVIRSFVTRGSMNVGAIVNVAVIAAVKELVFKLDDLTWQLALSFGAIFLSLGALYILEVIHYEKTRD